MNSEIHYHPAKSKYDGKNKKYAIQYCEDYVVVWEIERRVELGASMDLVWTDFYWFNIGDDLHYKEIGISKTKETSKVAAMPISMFDEYLAFVSQDDEADQYYLDCVEGTRVEIYTTRYERDSELRDQAIKIHGTACQACHFSFSKKYGEYGEGYIEVHHIRPLSKGLQKPDPRTDLVCLCANCHRIVHRNKNHVMPMDMLKSIIHS